MISKIAFFKVKKQHVAQAIEAIKTFVLGIKAHEPDTLVYKSFQYNDGVSFMHLMTFKDKDAEELHRNTRHIKQFAEDLYPLCDEEPRFVDIENVASVN